MEKLNCKNKLYIYNKMTKCKKGTRRCVNGFCFKKKYKHHFSKKKTKKCRKGTRRCADLKCHKLKIN